MKPSKSKHALSSDPSANYPEEPNTYNEWKTALQQVKVLYLKRQWKQCVENVTKLRIKPHPMHATYLHFYSATSNEAIARSIHILSISRLQTLDSAKKSYGAAASSLPTVEVAPNTQQDKFEPPVHSFSTSSSPPSTPTRATHNPTSSSSPPTPSSIDSTNASATSQNDIFNPPSPLHPIYHQMTSESPVTPPPTARPSSLAFTPSTISWLHDRSLSRYNAHLSSFAQMLTTHIHTINALIASTEQAQANRYTAKRIASAGDDEETRAADKRARIERMRKEGWVRERFCPDKYRDLCQRALAEL
ncbi:hypothetical protein MMC12_002712 [Toensbergia leucococca]|nr:hypothetical protein [Toensbergia leucococca]